MKVFVINMDSAKERLAFISEGLTNHGVEFTRIPAVNGSALPRAGFFADSGGGGMWQWWCHNARFPTSGERGCALSHMKTWKKVVEENLPCACILEDDVSIMPNIRENLEYLEKTIDGRDNNVYVISSGKDDLSDDFGLKKWSGASCMCGYVVTNKSARFLIAANTPLVYPCDTWDVWRKWGLSTYCLVPRSVAHWNRAVFGSTTCPSANTRSRCRRIMNAVFHKMKRLAGIAFDTLYFKIRQRDMYRRFKPSTRDCER